MYLLQILPLNRERFCMSMYNDKISVALEFMKTEYIQNCFDFRIAQRFSLKSKSYGKGDERHLVVSRKPSPWQIVEGLARVGGSTSKYELIIPGCSTK